MKYVVVNKTEIEKGCCSNYCTSRFFLSYEEAEKYKKELEETSKKLKIKDVFLIEERIDKNA